MDLPVIIDLADSNRRLYREPKQSSNMFGLSDYFSYSKVDNVITISICGTWNLYQLLGEIGIPVVMGIFASIYTWSVGGFLEGVNHGWGFAWVKPCEKLLDILVNRYSIDDDILNHQCEIVLTGHSRGGIMAIILGSLLDKKFNLGDRIQVVTFGLPRESMMLHLHEYEVILKRVIVIWNHSDMFNSFHKIPTTELTSHFRYILLPEIDQSLINEEDALRDFVVSEKNSVYVTYWREHPKIWAGIMAHSMEAYCTAIRLQTISINGMEDEQTIVPFLTKPAREISFGDDIGSIFL